jgi:MFS family permease
MTYIAFAFMGFIATGFTLSWACAKEVNRPRYAGMATGLANTGGFLAAGILQPLVGWVLDTTSASPSETDFRPALAMLVLFALSGLAGALFIRETRCRNIWAPATAQAEK